MNKMILNHACFMRTPFGQPVCRRGHRKEFPVCYNTIIHIAWAYFFMELLCLRYCSVFFSFNYFFYLNFWSKVVGVQCTAALDAIKENMEHFNEWKFIAISALISIFLFFNMNIDFSPRPKKGFSIKEANLPLANRNHIHSFVIFKSHL